MRGEAEILLSQGLQLPQRFGHRLPERKGSPELAGSFRYSSWHDDFSTFLSRSVWSRNGSSLGRFGLPPTVSSIVTCLLFDRCVLWQHGFKYFDHSLVISVASACRFVPGIEDGVDFVSKERSLLFNGPLHIRRNFWAVPWSLFDGLLHSQLKASDNWAHSWDRDFLFSLCQGEVYEIWGSWRILWKFQTIRKLMN